MQKEERKKSKKFKTCQGFYITCTTPTLLLHTWHSIIPNGVSPRMVTNIRLHTPQAERGEKRLSIPQKHNNVDVRWHAGMVRALCNMYIRGFSQLSKSVNATGTKSCPIPMSAYCLFLSCCLSWQSYLKNTFSPIYAMWTITSPSLSTGVAQGVFYVLFDEIEHQQPFSCSKTYCRCPKGTDWCLPKEITFVATFGRVICVALDMHTIFASEQGSPKIRRVHSSWGCKLPPIGTCPSELTSAT